MSSRFQARVCHRSRRAVWRLKPLSQAVALLLVAGSWSSTTQAQTRAFSSSWFADKNAVQSTAQRTGRMPDGSLAGIGNSARQQAESRQKLQRSLDNLNRTAAAVAAQQAAQAAARAAAAANGSSVPEGLTPGGLWVAEGALAKWEGAKAPQPGTEGGRQLVTIEQTQSRAILNWDTFNVGRNTTVQFKQGADDAVLNRVVGAGAKPSQIQGAIKGDGTVLVVNQNGVIFTGTSQVNVRNLVVVAATMTDAQLRERGIYADADATQPTFKDALGTIEVQAGARLSTAAPGTATRGGGYVLLAGKEVHNAGEISTPQGQALLAAGDSFIIRRGQGSDSNQASTTRGNEVQAAGQGLARNSGLIQSPQGDITLTGLRVEQAGVVLSTTSVDARGTIHLDARGSGAAVTLRESAVSAILVDTSLTTALDGQRASLLQPAVASNMALMPGDTFRRDLSLVQIGSQGTVDFQGGSLTLATGGQVAVKADGRALVQNGARIDVGGAVGVIVSMESNNLKINLQGNEQRDAPVNRDSKLLNNSDVWLDRRDLVRLAAGSGGNDADRWYTAGGLLEVGGYLGTLGVPVSHWLAQGGVVRFDGAQVVTQAGSAINLSGGTLDVQSGEIRQSWLRGDDGRLYLADRAPGDLLYAGLYRGYEAVSRRWGENATRRFYNPLIAPPTRYESGYTVGRDAGALVVSTRSAVLDGDLINDTYQGDRQTRPPVAGMDGYSASHRVAARAAQLVVGTYKPFYDRDGAFLRYQLGAAGTAADVVVGKGLAGAAADIDLTQALPAALAGKLALDADRLNGFGLGAIRLAASGRVTVDAALRSADGGEITLYAPSVSVNADLVSRGGLIQAGNVLWQPGADRLEEVALAPEAGKQAALRVASGVLLDARGGWSNLKQDPTAQRGLPWLDGGRIALRATGDVAVDAGSLLDVSSGASLMPNGEVRGGRGGSVTLEANVLALSSPTAGKLALSGQVRGYGMAGAGKLAVASGGRIVLGGPALDDGALRLDPALFQSGFANYDVNGHGGLQVAAAADIDVLVPVLRLQRAAGSLPDSGADPTDVLSVWTPPRYAENPVRGRLTQRAGAGLALRSDRNGAGGAIEIGEGARVAVDPGQTIAITGADQITVLGRLQAPGGIISIMDARSGITPYAPQASARSVWIGERAVLDVAGDSRVAVASDGRRYGVARAGGAIRIGGQLDWEADAYSTTRPMDRHLVLRPGSLLDASGAQALVDLPGRGATLLASNGGTLVLASASSLYLDGDLRAAAGGPGALGGTLALELMAGFYPKNTVQAPVLAERLLTLTQTRGPSLLPDDLRPGQTNSALQYGPGRLGVDQVQAGGFGNLALFATTRAQGDLTLAMAQSLRLSGSLSLADGAPVGSTLRLSAPYVFLNTAMHEAPAAGDSVVSPQATRQFWNKLGYRLQLQAGMLDVRGIRDFLVFDDVDLDVAGDMRLLYPSAGPSSAWPTHLLAPNRLTITAAQIYPGIGGSGRISAGNYRGMYWDLGNPDAVLTIRRAAGEVPAVPYSAFGNLFLSAPTVIQGGVVRAPFGAVQIEGREGDPAVVRFLPGSITSVSGQGLVMPFGGTPDGLKYQYGGKDITPAGVSGMDSSGGYAQFLRINATQIEAAPGSVLDLAGGGQLTGSAFVRGRGGSVDVLKYAMADANPGFGFSKPGNAVYAIVPGFAGAYAPNSRDAANPAYGQRVTIGAGVPGLPAGAYTLLPANFALLPGAFRVEVGAPGAVDVASAAATRGGSWVTSGQLTLPGADPNAAPASPLLLTSGDVVRRHAQYNETSYDAFLRAQAARTGNPLPMLLADGRMLRLDLMSGAGRGATPALAFNGVARFDAAPGSDGAKGTLSVDVRNGGLEILAPGQSPAMQGPGAAVSAISLNALSPGRMVLGGKLGSTHGSGLLSLSGDATSVLVRSGAALHAPEISLAAVSGGSITVEQGATLSTVGQGPALLDARRGYYYSSGSGAALVVSNGLINLRPPSSDARVAIEVGACLTQCSGLARLVSEGTIAAATNGAFKLGDNVEYGTRNLMLSVSAVNLGSAQAVAQAAAAGQLPPGLRLDQDLLAQLLRGNTALGAPALESLILNAAESVNIYGAVTLDTRAAAGPSALRRLVLGAPALYGYGAAGDVARISAPEFVWAGTVAAVPASGSVAPGSATPQQPGGAVLDRLGDGSLAISADTIRFDYSPYTLPANLVPVNRLALGFASVNLDAAQMITGVSNGSLQVYHKQDGYVAGEGWRYRDGDLVLRTPLLTGEAGSTLTLRAGGALTLTGTGADPAAREALGATLNLQARRIVLDSAVVLPSGRLTLKADGDITLGAASRIDLSGRDFRAFDVVRPSWGGDLDLHSTQGNIIQAAGSVIDLSAHNQRAGRMQAVALGAAAGHIALDGTILGAASGEHDAGGTRVPYDAAELTLRAQTLADFAGLNTRLNQGGVFGARRFQLKQGDVVVGDEVRARQVEIVADGGSLTLNGRIDASGRQVGSIRLVAQGDLRINGVLDAHGETLRLDSYGKVIDAANRAMVELTSRQGTLTLGAGTLIDLRAGVANPAPLGGRPLGTLDLNARRLGGGAGQGALAGSGDGANDVALAVAGAPTILGAKTVAVNAFRRYDDAPLAALPDVTGKRPQLITQGYLDGIDVQSQAFVNAALANDALTTRLAALGPYHLRPGVEIVSATPDGDLTVAGDLDLSNYRYGPAANRSVAALRGYGEPGALLLRAGGNLNIHGSINDGFAPPPDTVDDAGWKLVEGRYAGKTGQTPFGEDLVVPIDGVRLEAGTIFPAGRALNYDLPANPATLPAGTVLPMAATLNGPLALPAGLVLTGDLTLADGTLLKAGSVLRESLALGAGAQLGAGFTLRSDAALRAFTWPKGVALAAALTASAGIDLARGALIPSQTYIELPGHQPINLRPAGSDGKQGRNWALAPMLGAGATAWSLTAVAGADVASADMRARNADGRGDIILADTHYGVLGKGTQTVTAIFVADRVLTQAAIDALHLDQSLLGTSIKPIADAQQKSEDQFCAGTSYCEPAKRQVTSAGSVFWWGDESYTGRDAADLAAEYGMTEAEICENAIYCAGGGRTETTVVREYRYADRAPLFSVLRTGTGDLSLLAGRDVGMMSVFGVYTAGTPTSLGAQDARFNLARGAVNEYGALGMVQLDGKYDAALAAYRAWYPDQGGNLTVAAGRDVIGDGWSHNSVNALPFDHQDADRTLYASMSTANWLWRQGSMGTPGVDDIAASWWINFGTYVNNDPAHQGQPRVVGFTGFGTLGGGNLSITAGRDAGVREARGDALVANNGASGRSQGLVAAVGGTGRVVDGALVLTGGGDLDLRVGSAVNPNLRATQQSDGTSGAGGLHNGSRDHLDLNGVLVNLRGQLALSAGRVGGIALSYGDGGGLRATDPYGLAGGIAVGGPRIVLGDAVAWVDTRGDIVLGGTADAGRLRQLNTSPYVQGGQARSSGGESGFTLWTPATAINLYSAGGNLTPLTANNSFMSSPDIVAEDPLAGGGGNTRPYYVYPSILRAVAAGGNVILSANALNVGSSHVLMLAPSPSGALELLAGGSILASGAHAVSMSGADSAVPTPLRPLFAAGNGGPNGNSLVTNMSAEGTRISVDSAKPLFAFGPNTPLDAALRAGGDEPVRFYAVNGDIVGLRTGDVAAIQPSNLQGRPRMLLTWHEAALPLAVRAGRDILGLNALALHNGANEVSTVQAGRDMIHADLKVAGPGTLLMQAGRQLRQDDQASAISLGAIVRGDKRPGADIAVLAGVGQHGPDYAGFLARYLGAPVLAAGASLGAYPDQVAQSYAGELLLKDWLAAQFGYSGTEQNAPTELARQQALRDADPERKRRDLAQDFRQESELHLVNWLRTHHGYDGGKDGARAALDALASEQQGIYARQLYFAELRKGGREYNEQDGPRSGSYLRGRRAIAALFPQTDAQGAQRLYQGDFTMYGGAGLRTLFGGNIQLLTPGGQQVLGIEGAAPPASAGVVTQGQGDIQLYALGNVLLGQSRIMTTFGGHIQAWSAEGDINAGRGAKTTVIYTPPKRVYDALGNITLSPAAPSTGAGIATLAPIPEVPAGDVDLIAPLGTIDAGEAGIRVSGNVNVAALHVVNAANIQVQGDSKGIPLAAVVNTGALASASAASSAASGAAQDAVQRAQNQARQNQPSIISVQILGFGDEPAAGAPAPAQPRAAAPAYRPDGVVQVQGADGG